VQSDQDRISGSVPHPSSLIVKLRVSSAKPKKFQQTPLAFAQAPSTPLMAPSCLTPTAVDPRTVQYSDMQHFTAMFRKKDDLVRENTALKAQLAVAQEQLAGVAQVQEQHEQDIAQLLTQCQETIDRRDKQLARVNKLNSDAKVIVQEMLQMATDTARQAQEVAQLMTETAHKAQDLFSINSDEDDV
jgi:hypothetical protein